ncbi:MAG TPA: hypothetical protein PLS69_12295, partial [Terricaulis sp.]|nr:hypothetical protein [Terricaulis sp.]
MRKKLTHALAAALAIFIAAPAFADGPGDAGPNVAAPPVRAQPATPPPAAAAPAPAAQPAADPGPMPEGRTGQLAFDDVSYTVPAGYKFYPASEALAYLQRNDAATPP